LSLAASVAFVLMTAAGRKLAMRHSPLLTAGYGLLIAAGLLLPVVLVSAGFDVQRILSAASGWQSAGLLVYLGLVPTALAYICYCCGMARCTSATPGLVASMIEPAVAAALAFVLINEALTPLQALGCAVIMAAMVLLACGDRIISPLINRAATQPDRGRGNA
jgi:DME family drug/metabolite transporter